MLIVAVLIRAERAPVGRPEAENCVTAYVKQLLSVI